MLPLVIPGVITVAMFAFLSTWSGPGCDEAKEDVAFGPGHFQVG